MNRLVALGAVALSALCATETRAQEPMSPQMSLRAALPEGLVKTVIERLPPDQLAALEQAARYEVHRAQVDAEDQAAATGKVEQLVGARLALLVAANTFQSNSSALNAWQANDASELRTAAMAPEVANTRQGSMLLGTPEGLNVIKDLLRASPMIIRPARYCGESALIDVLRLGICLDRRNFKSVVGLAWKATGGQLAISCTGQLISKTLILTADHCFDGRKEYPVVLTHFTGGSEQALMANGTLATGLTKHVVANVHRGRTQPAEHGLRSFDLALVELTTPVAFDGFPKLSATLPSPLTFTVGGWGKTDVQPVNQIALEITVVSPHGTMRAIDSTLRAWPAMPVAGGGICEGDSGGPIFGGSPQSGGASVMRLVGVVAGGNEDCRSGDQVMTDLTRRESVDYVCSLATGVPDCVRT